MKSARGTRRAATVIGTTLLAIGAMAWPAVAQDDGHDHDHGSAVDPLSVGGTYTSTLSGISWWVPEGFQPITHGIPTAGEHAESYLHHAMVNYAGGASGELPADETQFLMEVGISPAGQLCLDRPATESTPETLIAALVDYNARLFPDQPFPPVEVEAATTWSDGTTAGTASMAMGEVTGEWTAWPLDDEVVAWLFVAGTPEADAAALSDRIATSITFDGDVVPLAELFADWTLAEPCAPLPAA